MPVVFSAGCFAGGGKAFYFLVLKMLMVDVAPDRQQCHVLMDVGKPRFHDDVVDLAAVGTLPVVKFLAMRRAYEGLSVKPDKALIDGNKKPGLPCEEETVVKGDSKSMSIAAASILAKVSRDRYMLEMAKFYPEYCFEQHKGYGTKLHYEKIREHGVSEIHRKTFLKKMH